MSSAPQSVLEALRKHAAERPQQKVWSFLGDSMDVNDSYSFLELENATSELAYQLIHRNKLKASDRVLLVFFPGLAFTASLLACFKAGIIAVPVFPPDPRKLQKDLHHFISIQKSSNAMYVLTHSAYNYAKKLADISNIFKSKNDLSWPQMKWILVDDILSQGKSVTSKITPNITPATDLAFLQYTSGSTSEPKGVMISHQNLAHNLTIIIKELQANNETVNVSWLPQYHDMGLIGSYLGTLYCGGTGYFISPISFLKDPNIWLKSISRYRGSHTQAPNFAYALAVRKFKALLYDKGYDADDISTSSELPPELKSFDLSCVKHMINAAEPVDVNSIKQFYQLFSKFNLPSQVVVPTYGLAEHTVFVCSDGKTVLTVKKSALELDQVDIVSAELLSRSTSDGSSDSSNLKSSAQPTSVALPYEPIGEQQVSGNEFTRTQQIVGCGFYKKAEGVNVQIIDLKTFTPVTAITTGMNGSTIDGSSIDSITVGEIWVDSPSKAQGYWDMQDATQEAFHARFNTSKSAQGSSEQMSARTYLRTGDKGFLYNDELFICGRIKDLIIIRGGNHYPQDIEKTAEQSNEHLRQGCSAAFAVTDDTNHTESVVYICELKPTVSSSTNLYDEIVQTVRTRVNREHGVSLACVCLLQASSAPKTTSGKITRNGCREAFLKNELKILHRWEVSNNTADLVDTTLESKENEENYNVSGVTERDAATKGSRLPKYTREEISQMNLEEIAQLLEQTLESVSSQGPSPLRAPIPRNVTMVSLGLDSFTLIQFKGALEKRFHCELSDEYLFTTAATLSTLSKVVKKGYLSTDDDNAETAEGPSEMDLSRQGSGVANSPLEIGGEHKNEPSSKVSAKGRKKGRKGSKARGGEIEQSTPCCPWFTCCY